MASEALAQKAVENVVKESRESGSEPPAGITGQNTTDSPNDEGNLPETATQAGIEPHSGVNGVGTMQDSSDQGNAPEQQQALGGKTENSEPTGSPEHQGSGTPQVEPNRGGAQGITIDKSLLEGNDKDSADKFQESISTAVEGGKFEVAKDGSAKEAKRKVSEQRDVSPGTLPDGSHAKTASDRGDVYEVSKLSKFKNKLGFGKS